MTNFLYTRRIVQAILLSIFLSAAYAGEPKPGELDEFILWSASSTLATYSPEKLSEALKPFKVTTEETYTDQRYLFVRGFPHFVDGVIKFRFQMTGNKKPGDRWALLDASFYFPGLSQADTHQIINKLNQALGKARNSSDRNSILTTRWMLSEFVEFDIRLDKAVGNFGITYSVLQGEMPF